jgi:glucose-6-phosphate 1-dehydrogenase
MGRRRASVNDDRHAGTPLLQRGRRGCSTCELAKSKTARSHARANGFETYCALRLFIDSWRWQGVPWYLRSGKYLASKTAEVVVQLKSPPQSLFADSPRHAAAANYL